MSTWSVGTVASGKAFEAGLRWIVVRDLKHLLAEGAPITYAAAQLGHAKPSTTLLHYARWLPGGDRGWAARLAQRRETA